MALAGPLQSAGIEPPVDRSYHVWGAFEKARREEHARAGGCAKEAGWASRGVRGKRDDQASARAAGIGLLTGCTGAKCAACTSVTTAARSPTTTARGVTTLSADPRHAAISRLMENHRGWTERYGSAAVVALTLSHLRAAAQVPPELLEAACDRLVASHTGWEPPQPGHVRSELLRLGWVPGSRPRGVPALGAGQRALTREEAAQAIALQNQGKGEFYRERRKRAAQREGGA